MRLSFATSLPILEKALERMARVLEGRVVAA
jgi:bifunctional pyridoxal-dependent enzyme with beta-cystathionase and maltose regulon repressor activities